MNRKNKKRGGVPLYVSNNLSYKVVEKMLTTIDEVMECISVKICMEKQKNVIVSCVYRAPGSSIETVAVCNIDLLNSHKHKMTEVYIH